MWHTLPCSPCQWDGHGARGEAGSGAEGLGKVLESRVTSITASGQAVRLPDFGLFFPKSSYWGCFPGARCSISPPASGKTAAGEKGSVEPALPALMHP